MRAIRKRPPVTFFSCQFIINWSTVTRWTKASTWAWLTSMKVSTFSSTTNYWTRSPIPVHFICSTLHYQIFMCFFSEKFCKSLSNFKLDWLIRTNVVGRVVATAHDGEFEFWKLNHYLGYRRLYLLFILQHKWCPDWPTPHRQWSGFWSDCRSRIFSHSPVAVKWRTNLHMTTQFGVTFCGGISLVNICFFHLFLPFKFKNYLLSWRQSRWECQKTLLDREKHSPGTIYEGPIGVGSSATGKGTTAQFAAAATSTTGATPWPTASMATGGATSTYSATGSRHYWRSDR